eukprot:10078255-Ditylum_brightwellii.AAC.1
MREERYGREWDGDNDDGREYGSRKKARRIGSFGGVDETEISYQGFINVPEQIWRNELSKDKKEFVAAYNAKKQHGESTANLVIPKKIKRLLKERETQ